MSTMTSKIKHFIQSKMMIMSMVILLSPATRSEIVFEFNYSTTPEFSDPNLGAARRAALEDAAFLLGSQFVNQATIQIDVETENDPDSDGLASAGSHVIDAPDDFFGYFPSVIEEKILRGVDQNGDEADGVVSINFGLPWDLDNDIRSDQFDFKATIIHELLHAVGFSSSLDESGLDVYGTPPSEPGVWSVFDQYLTDVDQRPIIDEDFALSESLWESTRTGGSSPMDGLFFSGPNAMEANSGKPVGLYSPSFWQDGSSGSHLDDDNPELAGSLMLAATDVGPYTRNLTLIERAILTDLGYDVVPGTDEPEPVGKPIMEIALEGNLAIVTLLAKPGDYRIESSSDLKNWETLGTVGDWPGRGWSCF